MVAATISLYGDQMTTIALLVLLYQVTGRITAPAAYLLAKQLPRMAGAGPGGALADRFSPGRVVVVCSLAQGVAVAAVIPSGHARSAAGIFALVVAGQLAAGMSRAAMGAILPWIVAGEGLARANALLQLVQNTAFVAAPLLAAPLLALEGPDALLAADVGTFGVAAVLLLGLSGQHPGVTHRPGMLSGLRIVAGDPFLRTLAAAFAAEGVAVNLAAAVFVVLARERLGGDSAVAVLYAAVGVGDAAGGLLMLRIRPRHVGVLQVALPGAASVAVLSLLAVSRTWWSAALPLLACGMAAIVYQTLGVSEAQRVTPRELMGRVSAALVLAQSAGLLLGAGVQVVLLTSVSWEAALPICCLTTAGLLVVAGVVGRARLHGDAAVSTVRERPAVQDTAGG